MSITEALGGFFLSEEKIFNCFVLDVLAFVLSVFSSPALLLFGGLALRPLGLQRLFLFHGRSRFPVAIFSEDIRVVVLMFPSLSIVSVSFEWLLFSLFSSLTLLFETLLGK